MGTALSELIAQAAYGKSAWKQACRTVSTGNITLSGAQLVNGVSLNIGDRVLVAGQTSSAQNGPYLVSNGPWTRTVDFDTSSDAQLGARFAILEGTFAGQTWSLTSPTSGDIALGVTALTFAEADGGWPGTSAGAIDANDVYAYACDELTGPTLANAGSGVSGSLTVTGGAQYNSLWMAKSVGSVRLLGNASGDGAFSAGVESFTGGSCTLEAYITPRDNNRFGWICGLSSTSLNDWILLAQNYPGGGAQSFFSIAVRTGGATTATPAGGISGLRDTRLVVNQPVHIAGTFDGATSILKLYVNGILSDVVTSGNAALPTLSRVSVGNLGPAAHTGLSLQSFCGDVMQVRFSNVVRSDAYILARAQNCFGL